MNTTDIGIGGNREHLEIIFAMYQSGMPIKQISSIVKIDVEKLEKMVADEKI